MYTNLNDRDCGLHRHVQIINLKLSKTKRNIQLIF